MKSKYLRGTGDCGSVFEGEFNIVKYVCSYCFEHIVEAADENYTNHYCRLMIMGVIMRK